jgi:hypothetical protein
MRRFPFRICIRIPYFDLSHRLLNGHPSVHNDIYIKMLEIMRIVQWKENGNENGSVWLGGGVKNIALSRSTLLCVTATMTMITSEVLTQCVS